MNSTAAIAVVDSRSVVPSDGGYQSALGSWSAGRMEGFYAEGTVSASYLMPPPIVVGTQLQVNPTTRFAVSHSIGWRIHVNRIKR